MMAYRRPVKDVPLYVRARRAYRRELRIRKCFNGALSWLTQFLVLCLGAVLLAMFVNLMVGKSPSEAMKYYNDNYFGVGK